MEVKRINDYVESVHKKFPELTEDEIKRILVYGWKMIIQYVSAGNDVCFGLGDKFVFIGKLYNNKLAQFRAYCKKLATRIQYMFNRTYSKWDGYYYFARSENQYLDYLAQSKKKKKVFKDVFLYKLLEELKVREPSQQYIFRLNEDKTVWFRKYYKEIVTQNAELIITRDSLTYKDILTSTHKYKYIQK